MDLDELVREVAERNGCRVVLYFLTEGIGLSRVAPIRHTHCEIMAFNEAGRYVRRIGSPIIGTSLQPMHSAGL